MGKRRQFRHEEKGAPRIPAGLVAPKAQILYVPVTKAASTTVKTMLAKAEESYVEPMLDFTPYSTAFAADFVHSPRVHGLMRYRDLCLSDKLTALNSDHWWRVAVIRNPYDRIVSTWQNRVVMLGTALPSEIQTHLEFTYDSCGRLDVVASFANFVEALAEHRSVFFIDDHFRPQTRALRCPKIDFSHVVRLEQPGHLEEFRLELADRTNREIPLPHFNEGLGIRTEHVMSQRAASLLEDVYAEDFHNLGYSFERFPDNPGARIFSHEATRLSLFLLDVVADRETRRGVRYGARQFRSRLLAT